MSTAIAELVLTSIGLTIAGTGGKACINSGINWQRVLT
ncbi:hypothetical protein RintRC_7451 [Richelia intracellularis]|nr:hypothetical protein RintRC_7451 [Richelia intracellularis]